MAPQTEPDFHWVGTDEPHASRRKEILKKHPEILELYGPDITTFYWIVSIFCGQLFFAYQLRESPIWLIVFISYFTGTFSHTLSLSIHELSHNLVFKDTLSNQLAGIFANLVQGVPSAILFKKYHLEHHLYQGIPGVDVDLPTKFEGMMFRSIPTKIIWIFLQPLWYGVRPLVVRPKDPCVMQVMNTVVQLMFDFMIVYFWGYKSLLYLVSGTLLSMGLHPVAGHFISEHYEFTPDQETYSYYGPLNLVCFNVGYHNEHHDFPRIAGSRLPKVREIAPEYYNNLRYYDSWSKVLWDFIFDGRISPFSRVLRKQKKNAAPSSQVE